jgi:hypothetical protein
MSLSSNLPAARTLCARVIALRASASITIKRHQFAIAFAMMAISSCLLIPALKDKIQGDTALYSGLAEDIGAGVIPYRDSVVEYPPYAIPIFILPRQFGVENYLETFMALALIADWAIKLGLFRMGLRYSEGNRAFLPLFIYCAGVPFLRYFFLQRYDIFPTLVCVGGIALFLSRSFGLAGFAMAIGIGVKVYPIVLLPPLFVLAVRNGAGRRFSIGCVLGLLPLIPLAFAFPWWRFAQFHASRGLQVESVYASALWLGKWLQLFSVSWTYEQKWYEVHGAAADALLPWARIIFLLVMVASTAAAVLVAARSRDISPTRVCRILLVPLLGFVAFNQVFSPQFMIWLLPIAALTALQGNLQLPAAILFATALTPLIFPSFRGHYYTGLNLWETAVLVVRNLILVGLWISLVFDCQKSSQVP